MGKIRWKGIFLANFSFYPGIWCGVLLFRDELSTRKLSRDWYHVVWDEEMFSIPLYSSSSGISKAWLTQYDPGLVTPRKAITNGNWKVTRLTLLTNLTVTGTFYGKIGLKHLCDALISTNCKSVNNLNVSCNELGEEGKRSCLLCRPADEEINEMKK